VLSGSCMNDLVSQTLVELTCTRCDMRHCNNTQYLMWSVVFDRANRLECVETESLESGQIYITVRLFAYNSLDLRMLPVVQYTHPRGLTTRGLGSGAHPYTPAGYTTFYSAPTYPGNCGTCCHARPALLIALASETDAMSPKPLCLPANS